MSFLSYFSVLSKFSLEKDKKLPQVRQVVKVYPKFPIPTVASNEDSIHSRVQI